MRILRHTPMGYWCQKRETFQFIPTDFVIQFEQVVL